MPIPAPNPNPTSPEIFFISWWKFLVKNDASFPYSSLTLAGCLASGIPGSLVQVCSLFEDLGVCASNNCNPGESHKDLEL